MIKFFEHYSAQDKIDKTKIKVLVVSYLNLCWLNLTMLSTAAMMKNMSIGSNRMYWEMVIQPVSVRRVKHKFILLITTATIDALNGLTFK